MLGDDVAEKLKALVEGVGDVAGAEARVELAIAELVRGGMEAAACEPWRMKLKRKERSDVFSTRIRPLPLSATNSVAPSTERARPCG